MKSLKSCVIGRCPTAGAAATQLMVVLVMVVLVMVALEVAH